MAEAKWMIYGAYGYTGTLIAEEAVRRGHRPVLAGRSAEKLRPLAERLDLDWIAVSLDDADALREAVATVNLVMHAAGPYVHTAAPMLRACLDGITSYLDITGEIPVFGEVYSLDQAAWEREIALIPGVGFDVVPTDCLAKYVADQVPNPVTLELAIDALSKTSPGTTKTLLESLPEGGLVRRDGRLRPYSLGQGGRWFSFPHGRRYAMPIPWGDLATAYRSTGIPNITTYLAFSPGAARLARLAAPLLGGLLRIGAIRRLVGRIVKRTVKGPDEATRQQARSYIWAQAANAEGQESQAWLETVEAYRFTALAAVRAVERVLAERPRGAFTPAQAFGADFVLDIEGTKRYDTLPALQRTP